MGSCPQMVEPATKTAAALEQRSAEVEAAVRSAWRAVPALSGGEGLALLAMGGFGRRELFPHSDVDLLLLSENMGLAERRRTAISDFLQRLWDSGLRVSHSVRTTAECCELDGRNLELSTSLLDQRLLDGDSKLYAGFLPRLRRFFYGQRQALAFHLCRLARVRHARHCDAIYELEPDVKESPGGLRDFQLVRWLNQLRRAQLDHLPHPENPPELEPARQFLFWLRCELHRRAGRDSNRLTFDIQDELAPEPAAWMREYFRHARAVFAAATRAMDAVELQASPLLLQFRQWRSRLANSEFAVSREQVFLRAPRQLEFDPELALRLFQFVARHGIKLAPETERRLAEGRPHLARYFAAPRPVWPALRELFSLPHAPLALRAMHESGILTAILPEWEQIDCLVVRDFYHRYTVDEHTLRAVQNLWQLRGAAEGGKARFAELFSEVEDPSLLAFALLFHDVGKADAAGAHVRQSVRAAAAALERIQAPPAAGRVILSLIEMHLEPWAVIRTRDLGDPATAAWLAERAGTVEILKQLTLLAWADLSAVNPEALTPWRAEQLWRLYRSSYDRLTRALEIERIAAGAFPSAEGTEFFSGFPLRYLRTHSEPQIEAHLELERRRRSRGAAVDLSKEDSGYRLTVIAQDRPYLLASLAGTLAAFGMNILRAEGFSNRQGVVLDEFVFADPLRTLELNPPEIERLRRMLERVALGKADARALLEGRPRPPIPSRRSRLRPTVAVDNDGPQAATLIEVVAEDRPALLHDLARTISSAGCDIELILIETEAHKAIDVFYVTLAGAKLTSAQAAALREGLLAVCERR